MFFSQVTEKIFEALIIWWVRKSGAPGTLWYCGGRKPQNGLSGGLFARFIQMKAHIPVRGNSTSRIHLIHISRGHRISLRASSCQWKVDSSLDTGDEGTVQHRPGLGEARENRGPRIWGVTSAPPEARSLHLPPSLSVTCATPALAQQPWPSGLPCVLRPRHLAGLTWSGASEVPTESVLCVG